MGARSNSFVSETPCTIFRYIISVDYSTSLKCYHPSCIKSKFQFCVQLQAAVHILLADRHLLNNWPIEAEKVIYYNDVTM